MLRSRNILKLYRNLSSTTSQQQPKSKGGIGGLLILPLVVFGGTVGAAYLREHDKIPIESVKNQLEFLQPIQDFLRIKGYGKDVTPTTPSEPEEPMIVVHKDDYLEHYEPEEVTKDTLVEEEQPKADNDETFEHPAVEESPPEPIQSIVEEVQPVIEQEEQIKEQVLPSPPTTLVEETSQPAPPAESSSNDHFLQLRVATLDNLLEDVAKQTAELKSETEKALFRDLENLDEQSLRYRIVQLSAEFFDRIKWEGLRQQQVLRDAEATFAQKYGQLLSEQKSELNITLEKKLLEKEKELLSEHHRKISELSEAYEKRLADALSNQALQLTNATKSEVEKNENMLRIQLQEEFTHQVAMLRQEHVKKSLQAQEAVLEQSVQIKALSDLVSTEFGKTTVSANVHGLSASVLLIESALLSGASVQKEVAALKNHASDDELVLALISSLPRCATTKSGIPTLADIRHRFYIVKDEVRKAGLAPENAPPLVGQLIGNALALISIEPSKPIEGEGIEAILSRTNGFVEEGRLDLALKEVENIKGYPRKLMADWEEMLRNRLIAEQVVEGLRAITALKHVQFL